MAATPTQVDLPADVSPLTVRLALVDSDVQAFAKGAQAVAERFGELVMRGWPSDEGIHAFFPRYEAAVEQAKFEECVPLEAVSDRSLEAVAPELVELWLLARRLNQLGELGFDLDTAIGWMLDELYPDGLPDGFVDAADRLKASDGS